jgi:hypothetical protein
MRIRNTAWVNADPVLAAGDSDLKYAKRKFWVYWNSSQLSYLWSESNPPGNVMYA